jgi:hypothetical protein
MKNWLSILLVCCCLMGCKESQPSTTKPLTENPKAMEGKSITVEGKALNAKAGAMVGSYYVEGLTSWPEEAYDKTVEVTGTLKTIDHKAEDLVNEKGEYSQGMVGTQYILTNPKWKVVK